jgi:hypothetical protein
MVLGSKEMNNLHYGVMSGNNPVNPSGGADGK